MTADTPAFTAGPSAPESPAQPMAFDYGMTAHNSMSPTWDGPAGDQTLYGQSTSQPYMFGSYAPHSFDPLTYTPFDDLSGGMGSMMDPPHSESFTASGLPFRGLDFIRNYTNDGYSGDQALWQTFDAGAFVHDPDMPFSLEVSQDGSGDGHLFSNSSN